MIQGGDPEGNGMGGPGYEFPNEIHADLVHKKGVISMANAGPNTNGSQFFITVAETSFLNGNYSVFGTVLEGQEVADAISKVERSAEDRPNEPVIMTKVEIIRVGKNFLKWDAVAAFNKGRADFEARQMQIKKEAEEAKAMQEAFVLSKYPNATISSTGLRYIVHDIGSGRKPNNGEIVAVHYAGYFLDGKLFDSSIKAIAEANEQYNPQREPYAPMEVPYGPSAQLIPGFKEGMMLLNVGGKATLIIPPSLAYGERGAGGVIPPNAWLIFDIELVSVK
jgi:FKBP-type peptidyl-prolyl cis-trans isomerase